MRPKNPPARPALKTYSVKIKKKIQETKDSFSFVFEIPQEYRSLFIYTPAQFLTFDFKIKGERFLRSYSLSSCPLLNEELKTTVKRVPEGVVSNYMIDHLQPGDSILSRKPAGRFFKPPKDLKPKHYFLFAGGSGITPLFSIIKTVLISDPENKVHLLYANRDESSIIYHKELKDWSARFNNRFSITHILSREKKTGQHFYGRLKTEHLKKYFLNIETCHPDCLYYLCGPVGFMQIAQNFLKQVKKEQIKTESFFTAEQKRKLSETQKKSSEALSLPTKKNPEPEHNKESLKSTQSLETPITSSEEQNKKPEVLLMGKEGESETANPEIIRASLNEEIIEIEALPDIPILEQLLSAGYSPPFSCLSGSCMSCLAVLKKGQIHQEERGILEDENMEKQEILTCQALPKSRIVQVDYNI